MPLDIELPAQGEIPYVEVWMENPLKEDVFLEAVQVRPRNPAVAHHGGVFMRELPPGTRLGKAQQYPGGQMIPQPVAVDPSAGLRLRQQRGFTARFAPDAQLVLFRPGGGYNRFPEGTAKRVHAARLLFNWQIEYDFVEPLKVPAGSTLKTVGHFDNSIRNRYNPSPDQEVYWGEQSWDEMFFIFTKYTVDKNDLGLEN